MCSRQNEHTKKLESVLEDEKETVAVKVRVKCSVVELSCHNIREGERESGVRQ